MATKQHTLSHKSPAAYGQADTKGRISLGKSFAKALPIVEMSDDGTTVVLRRAEAIPAREAWLFKNPKAAKLVNQGLEDIRAGRVSKGPNLDADDNLVNLLED